MADPADNTPYPVEIELLPAIVANDRMNDSGIEHDVVHDKSNGCVNALMELVGTTVDTQPGTVLGRLAAIEDKPAIAPVVLLSGTSYSLSDLTVGAWHVLTNDALVTITIFDEADEAVSENAEYGIRVRGAAGATIVADDSAEIFPPKGGTTILEQLDFVVLKRTGPDEYDLVGSTEAEP